MTKTSKPENTRKHGFTENTRKLGFIDKRIKPDFESAANSGHFRVLLKRVLNQDAGQSDTTRLTPIRDVYDTNKWEHLLRTFPVGTTPSDDLSCTSATNGSKTLAHFRNGSQSSQR